MADNYYTILGIPRDADEREIKRAYHRLARELHPDKAETPEKGKEMEQKFALVSTAYNLLKDPDARREYDRKTFGDAGGAGAPRPGPSASGPSPSASGTSLPSAAPSSSSPASSSGSSLVSSTASTVPGGADTGAKRQAIAQKAYVKGLQLMKEKNFPKAAEFFEAAIQNNPGEAVYHSRLALSLIEAKKSASKAIEAAQKAIDLDKYNMDYKFILADIYNAIGSKSNAIKVYEEILKWDKDNQAAQQMLRQLNKKGGLGDFFDSIKKKFSK